jgi:toxin ParE1/3/4
LKEAYDAIAERRLSFPEYLAGTRRALLRRYPYLVVFRELPDCIQVFAIAHGSRRPGYWFRRLKPDQ